MEPPKKSGPPRRSGPGGPKRPGGPGGPGKRPGFAPGRDEATGGKPRFAKPGERAQPGRGPRPDAAPGEERAGRGRTRTRPVTAKADAPRPDRSRADAPARPPRRNDGDKPRGAAFGAAAKPWANKPPRRSGTGPKTTANPHPAHATASDGQGEPQRIAKLLARAGIASRREVERMIEEGRVTLDGATVETPATLLASLAGVAVDGVAVAAPAPTRLFLFHKPSGFLTAERDPVGRPTIYDRLPADLPRVIPIGRLDMNTEGLLLLTTDGGFKRQMELPSTGVPRTYRARAFGEISQQQLEDLFDGLEVDGVRYGPIEANLERRTGRNQWIEMTLTEGKNREVRRVLEHLGLQVNRLIRTSYGPFVLADLPMGAVAEVGEQDLAIFRKTLKDAK